jgi:hypothetical protein
LLFGANAYFSIIFLLTSDAERLSDVPKNTTEKKTVVKRSWGKKKKAFQFFSLLLPVFTTHNHFHQFKHHFFSVSPLLPTLFHSFS